MNMRVVAAGSGQNVVVVGGVSDLLTNVDFAAIDSGKCGPIYQTIDEWRIRILKNLLDSARKLVGRLRPIVVFHGDYENGFDSVFAIFRACDQVAQCKQQGKSAQRAETSDVRH